MPTRKTGIRHLNTVVRKHALRWKRRRKLPPLADRVQIGSRIGKSDIGEQDPAN